MSEMVRLLLLQPIGRYYTVLISRDMAKKKVARGAAVRVNDDEYREVVPAHPVPQIDQAPSTRRRGKRKDDG